MRPFTIIIPAKNEARGLTILLPQLRNLYPDAQVIVVNDGSTDETEEICQKNKVEVCTHPYSQGNGAAIKAGIRAARHSTVVCMDADCQHRSEDIKFLIEGIEKGYDMVVGARSRSSQAGSLRAFGNGFYNRLATWMVGQPVKDLTSGFRAVKTNKFKQFLDLLPNGFSYPTTITMSFFRSGYTVKYHPIVAPERIGTSHLNIWKDGTRFLLIIFKIGTLYSPLKIFTPVSFLAFALGLLHYANTYITARTFTNMSALLFVTAVLVFLMGLISEQIASLLYTVSSKQQKVQELESDDR